MPKRIKPIHLIVGILIFAMVMALFVVTALTEYRRAVAREKQAVSEQLNLTKSQVESVINTKLQAAQGIVAHIETHPDLTNEEFIAYSSKLMPFGDSMIRNIGILKDTTIRYVFPIKGNEAAIGRDLATIDGQKEQVLFVKNKRQAYLSAPVNLVQGGRGIIYRTPILISSQAVTSTQTVTNTPPIADYWGQLSLVLDYDRLIAAITGNIKKSSLTVLITEYDTEMKIRRIIWAKKDGESVNELVGQVLGANEEEAFHVSDSIVRTLNTYHSEWTISALPDDGWKGDTPLFYLYILLGLLFSTVSSAYFITLQSTRTELEYQVEMQTSQLLRMNNDLEQSMAEIEEKQAEMIELNDFLETSLDELKQTQDQLIATEKYAALGELVAGVAHEINTPLGITVTMSSFLQEQHQKFHKALEEGNFKKSQLSDYHRQMEEGFEIMNKNLSRAAVLVSSFKQVAVDQSTLELRNFNVREYLDDVLHSLSPKFKHKDLQIFIVCPDDLKCLNYPGALSQIVSNLVTNSLLHGFPDDRSGTIQLTVKKSPKGIELVYKDDGVGIPPEHINHVFDPFFTTRKNHGSTGLGLHIIYNLVTQSMDGSIVLNSNPGEGVRFTIQIPDLHD